MQGNSIRRQPKTKDFQIKFKKRRTRQNLRPRWSPKGLV